MVRVPDIESPGSSPDIKWEDQKQQKNYIYQQSRESAHYPYPYPHQPYTARHQERQMPLMRTSEHQVLTERASQGYRQEVQQAEQLLKQQIETARTLSEQLSQQHRNSRQVSAAVLHSGAGAVSDSEPREQAAQISTSHL